MFLHKDCTPVLEIRLENGMTVYVNSQKEKETEDWYDMLEHIEWKKA